MAVSAQVVGAFIEHGYACLAVRVDNDGPDNTAIEYVGRVPIDDDFRALTTTQKKAALVAAVKAVRDAQKATPAALPAITGSVAL